MLIGKGMNNSKSMDFLCTSILLYETLKLLIFKPCCMSLNTCLLVKKAKEL